MLDIVEIARTEEKKRHLRTQLPYRNMSVVISVQRIFTFQ